MKEEITVNDKLKLIFKNGIKIYPVFDKRRKFAVFISDEYNVVYKKNKNTGEYKHDSKSINEAIEKTLDHVYNILIKNNFK